MFTYHKHYGYVNVVTVEDEVAKVTVRDNSTRDLHSIICELIDKRLTILKPLNDIYNRVRARSLDGWTIYDQVYMIIYT